MTHLSHKLIEKNRKVGGDRTEKKEEERKREKKREGGKRNGFALVLLELLKSSLKNKWLFFNFSQVKSLNFKSLNPFIMCWDNVKIDFLIYFIEK